MEEVKEEIIAKKKENSKITFHKAFSIALLLIILSLSVNQMLILNSQKIIVGVDNNEMPIPLYEQTEELKNLIGNERFTTYFLTTLFTWNSETYQNQMNRLMPLMTDDFRRTFAQEIYTNSYMRSVRNNNIRSGLQIDSISEIKPVRNQANSFEVQIKANRLLIENYIDRTIPVTIDLKFKTVNSTRSNIWGLEVFYLNEN